VKVLSGINREGAKSAKKSAKSILPKRRRIFGLVVRRSHAATKSSWWYFVSLRFGGEHGFAALTTKFP